VAISDIRSILQILMEIADWTGELFVSMERERQDRDETESEPRPSLYGASFNIPTILALNHRVLIPLKPV